MPAVSRSRTKGRRPGIASMAKITARKALSDRESESYGESFCIPSLGYN